MARAAMMDYIFEVIHTKRYQAAAEPTTKETNATSSQPRTSAFIIKQQQNQLIFKVTERDREKESNYVHRGKKNNTCFVLNLGRTLDAAMRASDDHWAVS